MKNIVIFGAPGSGKGTQSDLLVKKYGFKHISTGDVLRAEIKNGTELGKTAKSYIDNGQLIPDSLMIDILAATYDALCPCEGVIFDGFPRTIPQAEALKKMLADRNTEVAGMLELDVPEEMLMSALSTAVRLLVVPMTMLRPLGSASTYTMHRLLPSSNGMRRKASATL